MRVYRILRRVLVGSKMQSVQYCRRFDHMISTPEGYEQSSSSLCLYTGFHMKMDFGKKNYLVMSQTNNIGVTPPYDRRLQYFKYISAHMMDFYYEHQIIPMIQASTR